MSFDTHTLKATHHQKHKQVVLALVMMETTDGHNLYIDLSNGVDTWINKASPPVITDDNMNFNDRKMHKKDKNSTSMTH